MFKYDPYQKTDEEIRATFINGKNFLDEIVADLRPKNGKLSNQCVLITGKRGTGKSHFMKMLFLSILQEEKLRTHYFPVLFPEELFMAGSLYHFLRNALERIFSEVKRINSESNEIASLRQQYEDLCSIRAKGSKKEQLKKRLNIEKKFFILLIKISETIGCKIIFLLENLQDFLGEKISLYELKRLRTFLEENSDTLIIIGSAVVVFDRVGKYGQPFYNFFKHWKLPGLNREDTIRLIRAEAKQHGNAAVIERMEKHLGSVEVFRILTGGNPRLVLFLYDLLAEKEEILTDDILKKITELTPYFKAETENLSTAKQMIMDALCEDVPAQTSSEIAEYINDSPGIVHENLKRLTAEGKVHVVDTIKGRGVKKSETFYTVSDYFYRIWFQIRQSVANEDNLKWMAELAVLLFNEQELSIRCHHSKETLKPIYTMALELTQDKSYITRVNLLSDHQIDQEPLSEVTEDLKNLIEKEDWHGLVRRSAVMIRTGENIYMAHAHQGIAYANLGEHQKAIEAYEKALAISRDKHEALNNMGISYAHLGEYRKAIEAYEKAVAIKPDKHEALNNMGISYAHLGEHQKAIQAYEKALAIKPDMNDTLYNMGNSYVNLSEHQKAIEAYEKALAIKPDMNDTLYNMGNTYAKLGEHHKALEAFRLFMKYAPNYPWFACSTYSWLKEFSSKLFDEHACIEIITNRELSLSEKIKAVGEALCLDQFDGLETLVAAMFKSLETMPTDQRPTEELKELSFYLMFETILRLKDFNTDKNPVLTAKYYLKTSLILDNNRSNKEKLMGFIVNYLRNTNREAINRVKLSQIFTAWQEMQTELPEVISALVNAMHDPTSRASQVWSADPLFKAILEAIQEKND